MKNIFLDTRKVIPDEIDRLNHVNNVVYLEWIQEVSEKHWNELTKNNPQNSFIWVVLRHEIDYLASALLNDEVTLKTWVGETSRFKSLRYVEIFREDKLIAKSKTTWCLLQAKTLRPTTISEEILKLLQLKE